MTDDIDLNYAINENFTYDVRRDRCFVSKYGEKYDGSKELVLDSLDNHKNKTIRDIEEDLCKRCLYKELDVKTDNVDKNNVENNTFILTKNESNSIARIINLHNNNAHQFKIDHLKIFPFLCHSDEPFNVNEAIYLYLFFATNYLKDQHDNIDFLKQRCTTYIVPYTIVLYNDYTYENFKNLYVKEILIPYSI